MLIAIAVGIALGAFWQKYRQEYDGIRSQTTFANKSIEKLKGTVSELQEKIEKNQNAIIKIALESYLEKKGQVDFTNSQIQDIGSGFNVVGIEMKEHLTGIKFSGRIINTQSVRHKNATFKIKIGDREKNFTINKISAGNSTSFTVYVPDIKPEDAHYGEIKFQQSSVEYYIK